MDSTCNLYTGGPSSSPRSRGTCFLVRPDFKVVSFNPISPRVSWIKVQNHLLHYRVLREGPACFVNGYAPTEPGSNKNPEKLKSLYGDLYLALQEARKACNSPDVPVVGDFNIHVGEDLGGWDIHSNVLGKAVAAVVALAVSARDVE